MKNYQCKRGRLFLACCSCYLKSGGVARAKIPDLVKGFSLGEQIAEEEQLHACHQKSKLLLYHRLVLSKLSWHFTIADLGKTWANENIDNFVSKYIRQWLELPIRLFLLPV